MLAPRLLPTSYRTWNLRHGAPFGRGARWKKLLRTTLPLSWVTRLQGPFSIQTNNTFRTFEYPWAFHAARLTRGMRVLEVGGGLSGFQFILDRAGCQVVNVDPGMEAQGVGWPCDPESMDRLNRYFGTAVELRNTTLDRAALEPASFDRAFSISVLEHLPAEELATSMQEVFRCLKPGGLFVITLDLFLDVAPFAEPRTNKYGSNVSVAWLLDQAPFELHEGIPRELHGLDGFSPEGVRADLSKYLMGSYPALAQCLVLKKPVNGTSASGNG